MTFKILTVGALCASSAFAAPVSAQTQSTAEAIAALVWADNITITMSDGSFQYQSDGIPDHALPDQYVVPKDGNMPPFGGDGIDSFDVVDTQDWLQASSIDVTIPTTPVVAASNTDTPLGIIGVMVSGARLFNDYEDMQRQSPAIDDNVIVGDAQFLDTCDGHALQSGMDYHYHGVPYCITDVRDTADSHSTMIGVLMDGFPVYGRQGADGKIMTNEELDACSGHIEATPEFPEGIYHYHLTSDAAPYSIDCFHGEVDMTALMKESPFAGGPGGQRPDFAAIASDLGVSEHDLVDALGASMPPNLQLAAKALGISFETLLAAMPPPPNGGPAPQ